MATQHQYAAVVRTSAGSVQVVVTATDITRARAMVEATYGRGAVRLIASATSADLRRDGR